MDEGISCFPSVVTDYTISGKLEHYTCMVDFLGRAGQLEEAKNMVMAMLGSCIDDFAQHLQKS